MDEYDENQDVHEIIEIPIAPYTNQPYDPAWFQNDTYRSALRKRKAEELKIGIVLRLPAILALFLVGTSSFAVFTSFPLNFFLLLGLIASTINFLCICLSSY